MIALKFMILFLSLFLLYGCNVVTNKEEEIMINEELNLEIYYQDQVVMSAYIPDIEGYWLDDGAVIEELTVGTHSLFIHYTLKNDATNYKRPINISVKPVNLGHNLASEEVLTANYQLKNDDLQKGQLVNLDFIDDSLMIRTNQTFGTMVTPVMETPEFRSFVASWNSVTQANNYVEVMVRVRVNNIWSRYFSYQKWTKGGYNRTVDASDGIAGMSIDTLDVSGGKYATAFQLMVKLGRTTLEIPSPKVKLLAAALTLKDPVATVFEGDYYRVLEVPKITQMDEPGIGNIICSPTSTTMVLNSLGIDITKGIFAGLAKDQRGMYGNWSYNVAAAGELGTNAYVVQLTNVEDLKEYIAAGQPVVVSIRSSASNPLTGAPMQYTSGHLMVCKGFAMVDGVEYIVMNDPADSNVNNVEHYYKVSEFANTWKGYGYIISK